MKQSRAYQHTQALPKKTSERTQAFRAARDVYGFTEAALQHYAKGCRHASHWVEFHDNYLPNGTIKKGHRGRKHWQTSRRQGQTQARLANRQRKIAAYRKSLHGRVAHQIIRQGNTFLLEKISYRAWQRCYGQRVQKKPLFLRVHACPACGVEMQRDLYSAYLIRFVGPDSHLLHADQAREAWPGAESLLRTAWQQAHSIMQPASSGAIRSSHVGRRKAALRQSRSSAEGSPAKFKSPDAVTSRA